MKRTIFIMAFFAIACNATMAQEKFGQSQEKPERGSFATEINFTPFENNGKMFSLENGYALKFRYFLNEKNALRFKIGFGMDSKKYNYEESDDDYTSATEMKAKWGNFSLDLGYERHFNIHKRISLYAGAQLGIYKHFASASAESSTNGTEQVYVDSYWGSGYYQQSPYTTNSSTEYSNMIPSRYEAYGVEADEAYFGISASIFTGLDFYVYKGLYIGTELGLNIRSHKVCEREIKTSYNRTGHYADSSSDETKYDDGIRTTSVKFKVEPAIRLGWTF